VLIDLENLKDKYRNENGTIEDIKVWSKEDRGFEEYENDRSGI